MVLCLKHDHSSVLLFLDVLLCQFIVPQTYHPFLMSFSVKHRNQILSMCVLFLLNSIEHSKLFTFPYTFRNSISIINSCKFPLGMLNLCCKLNMPNILILIHHVHIMSHRLFTSFIVLFICEILLVYYMKCTLGLHRGLSTYSFFLGMVCV